MGGKSILQQFQDSANLYPALGRFAVAPKLDIQECIVAARKTFQTTRFHKTRCDLGLQALRHYHREWDAEKKIYLDHPVHDWCLAAGTQILTPTGWRVVESLNVHDHVLTPLGVRRILRSGLVRMTDQWTTVRGIRCTPEHRFFTNRGLVEAGQLSNRDVLWTQNAWGLKCLAFLCAILHFGFMDAITWATRERDAQRNEASSFIGWCMRLCMGRFRQAMTSIIETAIRGITTLITWRPSLALNIGLRTNQSHVFSVSALNAEHYSAVTKSSERSVPQPASGSGTHDMNVSSGQSVEQEPCYNITVEYDHCYFVRGSDGISYLVSNSSHCADAWRTVGLTWKPSKIQTPDPGDQPISTAAWTWKQAVDHHFAEKRASREDWV
jgi:hypothetical protein